MMYPKYSTLEGILVALSIPSALVNGYDCSSISGRDSCSDESSVIGYSQCKLQTYSISAFIQCASQSDAADFSATTDDDGGSKDISATDVLTNGLTPNGIPLAGCGDVPLAGNILRTANNHGSVNFARYLCDQYHPLNTGLCRLRNCLVCIFPSSLFLLKIFIVVIKLVATRMFCAETISCNPTLTRQRTKKADSESFPPTASGPNGTRRAFTQSFLLRQQARSHE